MRADRLIRLLLALGVLLVFLLVIAAVLFVSESALNVWQRLTSGPSWLLYTYATFFVLVVALATWLLLRALTLGRSRGRQPVSAGPPSEEEIRKRLADAEVAGIDVESARAELAELGARKAAGRIYVTLLGDISTGKSSLIRALLPGEEPEVSVRGGSTRAIRHYTWASEAHDELILTDAPGLHEADGTLDALSKAEAMRSHVVVYVCDGDLTQEQHEELSELIALGRPTIVAVNKSDRYSRSDLEQVLNRLCGRLAKLGTREISLVAISAGGQEEVVQVEPNGRERTVVRQREPDIEALAKAIQQLIDGDSEALDSLRDSSVFSLVGRYLDQVEAAHRREKSNQIIRQSVKKAVIGALAAVSPGTDLVIQGYLGTALVRELCALYGVSVREIEIQKFLDASQGQVGRVFPILLAVAGNAFKAFPGAGTVAGALVHAVAYGLIFEALGRSLQKTLESRGEFAAAPAAFSFKETLGEDLQARSERLARLALARHQGADETASED